MRSSAAATRTGGGGAAWPLSTTGTVWISPQALQRTRLPAYCSCADSCCPQGQANRMLMAGSRQVNVEGVQSTVQANGRGQPEQDLSRRNKAHTLAAWWRVCCGRWETMCELVYGAPLLI